MKNIMVKKFKDIRAILMDVDGVLTDGKIIFNSNGVELKNFNVQDGLGIKLAMKYGIKIFFVTSRESDVVEKRADDLNITECFQGINDKANIVITISEKYKISFENMAFIGDDFIDIPAMKTVGVPIAVSNARIEVKQIACYTTDMSSGNAAVREVIEKILKSQGYWQDLLNSYLS